MDAPLDRDIKLQKASADLLADLHRSLPDFLRKARKPSERSGRVRTRVRERETVRLINLLEPFQEWPQLLDPHLATLLPLLDSAFVEVLSTAGADAWINAPKTTSKGPHATIPLPRAICKLINVFCKIRGAKVICRFFNNEPRYLEPLLSAFEATRVGSEAVDDSDQNSKTSTVWEERYVMLLWLSLQLLAPFDLASISSVSPKSEDEQSVSGLDLPVNLPGITRRLVPLCLHYLMVASKESHSARTLLVRLALRPDMHKLGLLDSLLRWSLSSFEGEDSSSKERAPIFQHIGVLSFISGVLASADHAIIAPYILGIFQMAQGIVLEKTRLHRSINSSAIARKLLIKIYRAITIFTIQTAGSNGISAEKSSDILEDVIEYLLSAVADKDTPVRYAASKALSMITAKLSEDMAAEVVEAVVGSLAEDVLYEDEATGRQMAPAELNAAGCAPTKRNLTAVSPLRWHGLTLTIAHLLFHRSPPPKQLPEVLNSLLLSLEFEQRSPTGSSIGTNVRDAACFGIWALSRRYTTKELLKVDTSTIPAANRHGSSVSVPQVLATELIVAASIDLAGNIRRGASAALQELIGRHPDTIVEGISVVQVLDYHAVALRSRAITEVAMRASQLSGIYWNALFDAMLGWRGVGAADAASRRTAAAGIGMLSLAAVDDRASVEDMLGRIATALRRLDPRQVEEKHGLLLSTSAILETVITEGSLLGDPAIEERILTNVHASVDSVADTDVRSSVLRPELTAEAVCTLIASTMALISRTRLDDRVARGHDLGALLTKSTELISSCLARTEGGVIEASSIAARQLFTVLDPPRSATLVQSWVERVSGECHGDTGIYGRNFGYIAALGTVFSDLGACSNAPSEQQTSIISALVLCSRSGADMESRVAAMKTLTTGVIGSKVLTDSMSQVMIYCLDDYTIDSRGDVGSWIRLEAIDAVLMAVKQGLVLSSLPNISSSDEALISHVARLAAEKLDKVRTRAWQCLSQILVQLGETPATLDASMTSTTHYFLHLLSLLGKPYPWLRLPLLSGFVTSSGVGSESVLQASRSALCQFIESRPLPSATATSSNPSSNDLDLRTTLQSLISLNLSNDRVLVPALETLAFLLEAQLLPTSPPTLQSDRPSSWRAIFILVQKAHYRSTNVQKLEAAIRVYAGLADVEDIRNDVVKKLRGMLLHPFPKVRNSAADTLFSLSLHDSLLSRELLALLKNQDWSAPAKELKLKLAESLDESVV